MIQSEPDDPPVMSQAGWDADKPIGEVLKVPAFGRVWGRVDIVVERFGAKVAWQRAPNGWAGREWTVHSGGLGGLDYSFAPALSAEEIAARETARSKVPPDLEAYWTARNAAAAAASAAEPVPAMSRGSLRTRRL